MSKKDNNKNGNNSLREGASRATRLTGTKTQQHNDRVRAKLFAEELRNAGMGVQHWGSIRDRHFHEVADQMRERGCSDGWIADVFAGARNMCRAYNNDEISNDNSKFGVHRGSIANQISKAPSEEYVREKIDQIRECGHQHAERAAIQVEAMWELGLRREEAAKLDVPNNWNKEAQTLDVIYGTKGGRPRTMHVNEHQQEVLSKLEQYASPSDIPGRTNLMPEGFGDNWTSTMSNIVGKNGMTKEKDGYTLHSLRHGNLSNLYESQTGFPPPNKFDSVAEFQAHAYEVAGDGWKQLDSDARDLVETVAGHSAGRRDISDAYLGSSK